MTEVRPIPPLGDRGSRRCLVQVRISPAIFEKWFMTGNECHFRVIDNGLPEGARLYGRPEIDNGEIVLVFEHPSFPECGQGDFPQMRRPTLRGLECGRRP